MREILFRGKSNYEGRDPQWFYGGLLPESQNTFPIIVRDYDNDEEWIGIFDWATVDPETVGQYTGFTDKNGNKVFEGDILKAITSNAFGEDIEATVAVSLYDYELMWDIEHSHSIEVIGNIHDNKELLEGGAK